MITFSNVIMSWVRPCFLWYNGAPVSILITTNTIYLSALIISCLYTTIMAIRYDRLILISAYRQIWCVHSFAELFDRSPLTIVSRRVHHRRNWCHRTTPVHNCTCIVVLARDRMCISAATARRANYSVEAAGLVCRENLYR